MTTTGTIDEALELLRDTGPEFGGGLSNHGPMAAEALLALGRGDAVIPWVEQYLKRLQAAPESRNPFERANWREALGDIIRVGDWVSFFERELSEAPWQAVVAEWVPLLTPGLAGAAMHGVIRAAHAVRSLEAAETPARIEELARALGYWAARYWELPASDGGAGRLAPSEALRTVESLPEPEEGGRLIADGLVALSEHSSFSEVSGMVDTSTDPSAFLSDLTRTFASVSMKNVQGMGKTITFIHAVTGSSAIRLLSPHVPPSARQTLLRYGWQAAAAIYAAFGYALGEAPAHPSLDQDNLIDRAVATGDEHAIKFTEACLREHAIDPHPVYLAAASDAVGRFLGVRQRQSSRGC